MSRGNAELVKVDGTTQLVAGEAQKGQLTMFCSYRCFVEHRKATGQDDFGA